MRIRGTFWHDGVGRKDPPTIVECPPVEIPFVFVVEAEVSVTYSEWFFYPAGATGRLGPTQSDLDAGYAGTSLEGEVDIVSGEYQRWTVPETGTYRIRAIGAQAQGNPGSTTMEGDFSLGEGDTLYIMVGQMGHVGTEDIGGSGSGGTFVMKDPGSTALIVAGGAGGLPQQGSVSDMDAVVTNDGTGGGQSGADDDYAGAGGGYEESGGEPHGISTGRDGKAFIRDGFGGDANGDGFDGGFGGGGASSKDLGGTFPKFGAGGGGYTGGSWGNAANPEFDIYGGGGSYNDGANQDNRMTIKIAQHGSVRITRL